MLEPDTRVVRESPPRIEQPAVRGKASALEALAVKVKEVAKPPVDPYW